MLSALEDLSSPFASLSPPLPASSPTPLLAGESRSSGGYQSTSDDLPLQGAVLGAAANDVDSEQGQGEDNSRRYAIA